MTRAIILSGADRYDGRWHDHAATSQRVAEALAAVGIEARIRGSHPRAFGELAEADLLVVNTANGAIAADDASDDDWAGAFSVLDAYRQRGGPLLALHLSSAAFVGEYPAWREWIGGEWVVGTSMHPPISQATISMKSDAHPITGGLADIEVFDERYSYLELEPGNIVLATHRHDDLDHPMVWAREAGHGRVVYDALGHDVRSYDSADRIRLLQRSALWLTGANKDAISAV
jgi:type 1 glutamine amidotransferase